jgi:histone H3/H4
MRITERKIRYQVRQVMLESYMDTFDLEASDATRIESVWSKAVDIMASLENVLIEKYSSKIAQEAEEKLVYVARRRGIEPEDVKDSDVALDELTDEVDGYAARILEEDQNLAQEMKRLDGILKLVTILFLKKSKNIDNQGDAQRIAEFSQNNVSRLVCRSIARLAAAIAVSSVVGIPRAWLVGDEENQTVRQRADNTLYGVLQNVESTAIFIGRYL